MQIGAITRVTALVDWNSQIHAARIPRDQDENNLAERTLNYVGRTIGRCLNSADENSKFDVTLRLYHGWRKGFEETPRRKAILNSVSKADFPSLSIVPNVSIRSNIELGDNLISALPARIHARLNCHLPNTYRKHTKIDDEMEEKMVDTAIASDLVDLAHREMDRWLVVLAEDDDLVPPIFVAEAVREKKHGRIILVRKRTGTPFLKLESICYQP